MHHDQLDYLRTSIDSLFRYLHLGVLALLCDLLELVQRLLRYAVEERLHALLRLLDIAEELLGV